MKQSATAPALVAQRIYDFEPVAATLVGDLLYSDQEYWRHAGKRRCFWLLEEDVQLVYEPFGWQGEWYVDLVSFERTEREGLPLFTVRDQYLDVVVEGMGPTYRLIDLDEAAEALLSGDLSAATLARAMVKAQEFTDRYLHRGAVFPPPALRDLFDPGHRYPNWAPQPVRLRA